MSKIGIIILNFNGEKDTLECLKSLEKLQSENNIDTEIIVIDNGSIPEFKIEHLKFRKNVQLIKNKENIGFVGGNNVGIEYALEDKCDYVLILNNDTIVGTQLVNELVKTAELDEKIGIVVPKIYFEKGYEFHKERYKKEELGKIIWYAGGVMDWKNIIGFHKGVDDVDNGQYEKVEETEIATGCCMLVKSEVFKKVGLFDEKYFLYYEDADFSQRVKKAGYKIIFSPNAILWHKNAGSAGGSGSKLQDYYITRNRLLFGMKYASIRTKLALIKEGVKLFIAGRPWQRQGVLDFYFNKIGKGSYQ